MGNALRFWGDERGTTGIEYGLLAALVGIGALGALPFLSKAGESSLARFGGAFSAIESTPDPEPPGGRRRHYVN